MSAFAGRMWDLGPHYGIYRIKIIREMFEGDILAHACNDNYIYSEDMFICDYVLNLVIVQQQTLYWCINKDTVQDVKKLLIILKRNDVNENINNIKKFSAPGKYNVIDSGKITSLDVSPLSHEKFVAQMHHHRAEH